MKLLLRLTLLSFVIFPLFSTAWAVDKYPQTKKMFVDAGIGEKFNSAYGYAIFPTIGKVGFVVGGAYGEGRVYAQGKYLGDAVMTQATVGFQLGGTGFSQVVFFQDKRALEEFCNGDFEFGAGVHGVALTAAVGASANTGGSSATASGGKNNASTVGGGYNKGMATFTIVKGGLMYEISVGGQNFKFSRR